MENGDEERKGTKQTTNIENKISSSSSLCENKKKKRNVHGFNFDQGHQFIYIYFFFIIFLNILFGH